MPEFLPLRPSTVRPRFDAIVCTLREGRWLTPDRLRVYPMMIGSGFAMALVGLYATSHGLTDCWNRPLGTDFSGIWVAGNAVLAGHPTQPYDNVLHAAAQAAVFGPSDSFLQWPYPPYFLALAALFATMPYLVALATYQGITLGLYLGTVLRAGHALPRRETIVAALAFPAVTINILHGHNGLLSAALLAGGGLLLPRRPLLAGALLGLLAYKPQFALAIPVALLAGRHWRAIGASGLTIAAATLATCLVFGLEPWQAFADSLGFTRRVVLEGGGLEPYKLESAFAAVRLLGGSIPLAYGVQALVTMSVLMGLAWLWRGDADARLKLAGLIAASLLSTPYALDYDMTMLGPAFAALASYGVERGFAPWSKSLLALAWLTPLLARTSAVALDVPLGVLVMAALFVTIVLQARGPAHAFWTSASLAAGPRDRLVL